MIIGEIQALVEQLIEVAGLIRIAVEELDDDKRREYSKGSIQFSNQYEIDLIADSIVHEKLSDFDGYILSEEKEIDKSQIENNSNILVIDPIDGSSNASRKLGYWCFSAALVCDGQVKAGLVVDQVQQRIFCAIESQIPTLKYLDGRVIDLTAVKIAPVGSVVDNFFGNLINFNSHDGPTIPFRHLRDVGASALAICDVASGVFDAYIDGGDVMLKPWDVLAAEYIVKQSGGYVLRRESQGLFAASGVFACRSEVMVEACRELFPDFFRN